MTALTKAALRTKIASTLEDGGDNTAAEVRTILGDFIDSLALQSQVDGLPSRRTNAEIVQAINSALGNTSWQQGGGGSVTGITLAQAIAAVLVDGAAASGIELTRTATATTVTIGLQAVVSDAAFVGWSMDRTITDTDFTTAGANFDAATEGTVAGGASVPGVDTGAGFIAGYLWFALPTLSAILRTCSRRGSGSRTAHSPMREMSCTTAPLS